MRRSRGQYVVALIAGVFVTLAGLVVLLTGSGSEWGAFGWVLLIIGLLFTAANVMLATRSR